MEECECVCVNGVLLVLVNFWSATCKYVNNRNVQVVVASFVSVDADAIWFHGNRHQNRRRRLNNGVPQKCVPLISCSLLPRFDDPDDLFEPFVMATVRQNATKLNTHLEQ